MKHKFLRRFFSAITSASLLLSLGAVFPAETASAAQLCVVDTTTEYQTIRGFGGINLPEWISQGDLTDAQRKKAFGNGADELGLTVLRIYVSDDSNSWSRAVPTALYAQKMGATIFATPWNPPASMRENGTGGIRGGKYHLPSGNYSKYVDHLNSYYTYMKGQGVDVYSISVQNEPDYSEDWTAWSSDETTSFLANYGDKLNFRVMSPETFQYTNKDYYTKILNNPKAMANCDLFGTHFYGTQRSQMDFPALENCGKEIWMTEVYVPDSNSDADEWPKALKVSENIHNGLVVGNLNAYVWWYIRRSYGLIKENGNISKRGYCMAQYSKFVRPGDVRIDVTEQPSTGVYVSAYKNSDGQVTIVAVNTGSDSYAQQFSLGSGENITDIDRYRTSANENIALTENLEHDETSFWAQLPASSVSTFVISTNGEGSTPEPKVDEDGYFFHDTFEGDTFDWNARGASSILTSGRTAYKGSEALLIQERTSAWHGAGKSLNSKVFVPGNAYSFSVNAEYLDGGSSDHFMLKLQYKGSDGEVHYSEIASSDAVKGGWVQLANTSYTIPADATELLIYVETAESTGNFYIDEAIGAPEGTVIEGAGPAKDVIIGDIDFSGKIDTFDLILARKGVINGGFSDPYALRAADVNQDGTISISDAVLLSEYLLGKIKTFEEGYSQTEKKTDDDNKWDSYVETASENMIKFYSDSILQMGNTSRLCDKLEKGENGDKIKVAYLGGSITEGKKYTDPFSAYIKEAFAPNAEFINAGLSGTSSVVGLMRAQRDILDASPDIIFLEFSVNDHPEEIYKKGFESLVKKCLSQDNDPAVIILINRSKGGYSSKSQMAAIGKNFDVPVISMDDALTNAFNSGLLTTGDYFTDEYHPHDKGGQLISDCLGYFFRQAMKSQNRTGSYTIPSSSVYGCEYASASIVPVSELKNLNPGSFTPNNSNTRFAYGYSFQKNSANNALTFSAEGKGIFVVFQSNQNSSLGNLVVTVNGQSKTINGNRNYAWGGSDADIAYIQDNSGSLEVSLKMENANTDFNIYGIGVIK